MLASQTIASYWLPRHLVAFRRAYPRIEVRLAVGNTAQVAAAVHDGTAELGCVEGAVDDPALTSMTVAQDKLVLVVGPEHPWAGRERVEAQDLHPATGCCARQAPERAPFSRQRWKGSAWHRARSRWPWSCRRTRPCGRPWRPAWAATVLSASVAAPSLEAGLVVQVGLDLPDRAFHLLRHRERYQSRAADAFLRITGGTPPDSGARER